MCVCVCVFVCAHVCMCVCRGGGEAGGGDTGGGWGEACVCASIHVCVCGGGRWGGGEDRGVDLVPHHVKQCHKTLQKQLFIAFIQRYSAVSSIQIAIEMTFIM